MKTIVGIYIDSKNGSLLPGFFEATFHIIIHVCCMLKALANLSQMLQERRHLINVKCRLPNTAVYGSTPRKSELASTNRSTTACSLRIAFSLISSWILFFCWLLMNLRWWSSSLLALKKKIDSDFTLDSAGFSINRSRPFASFSKHNVLQNFTKGKNRSTVRNVLL